VNGVALTLECDRCRKISRPVVTLRKTRGGVLRVYGVTRFRVDGGRVRCPDCVDTEDALLDATEPTWAEWDAHISKEAGWADPKP
jgi:hypothetical protein